MNGVYNIIFIYDDHHQRIKEIQAGLTKRLEVLQLDKNQINLLDNPQSDQLDPADNIYLGIYIPGENTLKNQACDALLKWFFDENQLLFPLIFAGDYIKQTPESLHLVNGFIWTHHVHPLSNFINEALEALGITEKNRKVFLSYKRSDGSGIADQLFDALTRKGFTVFKDNYSIRSGEQIQQRIYEMLEEMAYVVLIDSPDAIKSKWVKAEIEFVMANQLGVTILKTPSTKIGLTEKFRLSKYLEKQITLKDIELTTGSKQIILTSNKLDDIINNIQASHAECLLQRKTDMVSSILLSAKDKGITATQKRNGQIVLHKATQQQKDILIGVSVRTPSPADFYHLDIQNKSVQKYLAHQTTVMANHRYKVNNWIMASKANLEMIEISVLLSSIL